MEDIWMVVRAIKTEESKNETAHTNNPNPHAESVPKWGVTEEVHQQQGYERNHNISPGSFVLSRQNAYHPVTVGDKRTLTLLHCTLAANCVRRYVVLRCFGVFSAVKLFGHSTNCAEDITKEI
jgi:hypothetical protein